MYDKETNSYWSHILGEAMQGPLKGQRLKQIPSVMSDWQNWRTQHPDGTVAMLKRTAQEYRREFYRRPEQFVLGIASPEKAKAWGFDQLLRDPVIEDQWEGKPVVVLFDRPSMTPRLYSRKLDGKKLTFQAAKGKIMDKETGSTWDATTGRALDGSLAGKSLPALPAIVSYRHVWLRFHSHSD